MHQEEVLRVGFKANFVRHPRSHGYGRDTCRANKRVNGTCCDCVHPFRHQDAAGRANAERHGADHEDVLRVRIQELFGLLLRSDCKAEDYRDDVDQRVLRRI